MPRRDPRRDPRREESDAEHRRRIAEILEALTRTDLICSGTVSERTKVCGKPNCRCATGPEARHGPYYEWTRREEGRLAHTIVSREEAERLERAIRNRRDIEQLLERWEHETVAIILHGRERKS